MHPRFLAVTPRADPRRCRRAAAEASPRPAPAAEPARARGTSRGSRNRGNRRRQGHTRGRASGEPAHPHERRSGVRRGERRARTRRRKPSSAKAARSATCSCTSRAACSGTFPAPTTPVVLDQRGCRYVPHVFGVQVGQPIEILNSDPTLHNIHATPKTNTEFNTAQPIQGMKTTHTFTAKEADVVVPFKCDVHGWMNASAGVLDHPYFAVTKPDGTFSIPNLPPGTYTLAAWHERLGTQDADVTVAAKESKSDANFTFKRPAARTRQQRDCRGLGFWASPGALHP